MQSLNKKKVRKIDFIIIFAILVLAGFSVWFQLRRKKSVSGCCGGCQGCEKAEDCAPKN